MLCYATLRYAMRGDDRVAALQLPGFAVVVDALQQQEEA